MASISGTVTIAGDPDDWIAVAWDAVTHAYAGEATVSGGAYTISGLTTGKPYFVGCWPKVGGVWLPSHSGYAVNDLIIPTSPVDDPYIFKAATVESGDPYWDDVVVSMNCDGPDSGTDFSGIDAKGHAFSRFGDAQFDTDRKKFGSAALLFDGSGDYIRNTDMSDLSLNSSDSFTFECWFYAVATPSNNTIMSLYSSSMWLELRLESSGPSITLRFKNIFVITHGTAVTTGEWHHLAAVRNGSTWTLYLDGVGSSTDTGGDALAAGSSLFIAREPIQTSWDFKGSLDDIRLTAGVARYTENFSPPNAAFIQSAGTPTGSSEPTWPTTPGNTVVDGGVTWTNMGQLLDPLIAGPLIAV